MRLCHKCNTEREDTDFYKDRSTCKFCTKKKSMVWREANRKRHREYSRGWRLENAYGITSEEYGKLLARQNGVCKICKDPPSEKYLLHVDHDHLTGKVRGLLCYKCNSGLGHFRDNPEFLVTAIAYLKESHEESGGS